MSTFLKPTLRPLAHHPPTLLAKPTSTTTFFPLSTPTPSPTTHIYTPHRHARLLRRPKRPYTFTQLVTLSDGSAFTLRTTSPLPVYRSTRDTRNAPLWNPNSKDLQNVEEDEAGRLKAFRGRFGVGFDASTSAVGKAEAEAQVTGKDGEGKEKRTTGEVAERDDDGFSSEEDANLMDLISLYNVEDGNKGQPWQMQKEKKEKKK